MESAACLSLALRHWRSFGEKMIQSPGSRCVGCSRTFARDRGKQGHDDQDTARPADAHDDDRRSLGATAPRRIQMKKTTFACTLFLLGALVTMASVSTASAGRSAFCSTWQKVCNRVCTAGASCPQLCQDRAGQCRGSGCFDLWTRTRCEGNAEDRNLAPCTNTGATCSAARDQCIRILSAANVNTSSCGSAFSRCMRDGSWKTTSCNRSGLGRQ
jgi:hypothetical protein